MVDCSPYLCFGQPLSRILGLWFFSMLLLVVWAYRNRNKYRTEYPDTGESGEAYDAEFESRLLRDSY